MNDLISRQAAIDAGRYTFGSDEFDLEVAYHDCKLIFDGITDDDSFQEADTGLILYYANEIIYALQKALEGKDTNVPSSCSESPNNSTLQPTCNQLATDCISRQAAIKEDRGHVEYTGVCDKCGFAWIWYDTREYLKFCPNCGADLTISALQEQDVHDTNVGGMISRQAAIDALYRVDEYNGRSVEAIRNLPSVQPEQDAYEQGRIAGRVEMRAEILSALKKMVGSEVWNNV